MLPRSRSVAAPLTILGLLVRGSPPVVLLSLATTTSKARVGAALAGRRGGSWDRKPEAGSGAVRTCSEEARAGPGGAGDMEPLYQQTHK